MPRNDIPPSTSRIDLENLKRWEGKTEVLHDEISAAPVRAMLATLDCEPANPAPADVLPPLWHWLYFLPHVRHSELGEDGHPRLGGFLPPVPLPRRMWAGGRLQWHSPLRVGDRVSRRSTIVSVDHKSGRTGDLIFVTVRHEIFRDEVVCMTEEHDIVYRAKASGIATASPPVVADASAVWQRTLVPDEVMLFRYSALTFNGHRIHYDRRHVTEVEGYEGLIVHGPLIATLLLDLACRHDDASRLKAFEFKAVGPVFDGTALHLNARPADAGEMELWAADHRGHLAMKAKAIFADGDR